MEESNQERCVVEVIRDVPHFGGVLKPGTRLLVKHGVITDTCNLWMLSYLDGEPALSLCPIEGRFKVVEGSLPEPAQSIRSRTITFGLAALKGVSEHAASQITEEREKNGDYKDLVDLVKRSGQDKGVIESLIKSGALDKILENGNRKQALKELPNLVKIASREKKQEQNGLRSIW